jgi:O-antigen/teichoic acid export membrane protein
MLKQKIVLSYGSMMITNVFSIIAGIIVARIAGPTVMGTVAFGLSFVMMWDFINDPGISTAHIKFVSEGRDQGKCLATYTRIKLGLVTIFLFVVFLTYFIQKLCLHVKYSSKATDLVILISLLTTLVSTIVQIPRASWFARIERAKIDLPSMIESISSKSIRILVAALGFGAVALSLVNLGTALLVLLPINLYFFMKEPFSKFDKQLAKDYLRYGAPLVFYAAAVNLFTYFDRVLLQNLTSVKQVGLYSVGFSFSQPFQYIGTVIGNLFFPLFSSKIAKSEFESIRQMILKYNRFLIIFILPVILLFVVYAPTLVWVLLGKAYLESVNVVRLVILGIFINIYQLPLGNLLMGSGKFRLAAIISWINTICFGGMIFFLASPHMLDMGATGAALAVLLSYLILTSLYYYAIRRLIPGLPYVRDFPFWLYQLAFAGVFYLIYSYFRGQNNLLVIYVFPFLFVILNFALQSATRMIKKSDWQALKKFLNLLELFGYIKREFKNRSSRNE